MQSKNPAKAGSRNEHVGSEQFLTQIISNFRLYSITSHKKYLNEAVKSARSLDELVNESGDVPLGLFHSAGSGFLVPRSLRNTFEAIPDTPILGYLKLSPHGAEIASKGYNHLAALRRQATAKSATTNAIWDAFVRHAYVPIPEPIFGMPSIGPLAVTSNTSFLFLNRVKGPLLHDFLESLDASIKTQTINGSRRDYEKLRHYLLFATSQMLGVLQAKLHNPVIHSTPENIRDVLKTSYMNRSETTLDGLIELTGLQVTSYQLERAHRALQFIIGSLALEPDPLTGNISPYSDAALRNWPLAIGDITSAPEKVFGAVRRDGNIAYDAFWDVLTRIDLDNSLRPWGISDEDCCQITENINVGRVSMPEQKAEYHAATTLTRLASLYDGAGKRSQAIEITEKLYDLRTGRIGVDDINEITSYNQRFGKTMDAMRWWRMLRGGYLSLLYYAKAEAYAAGHNPPPYQAVLKMLASETSKRSEESRYYLRSAHNLLEGFMESLHFSLTKRDLSVLSDMLYQLAERAKSREFSHDAMMRIGEQYLKAHS